jgi:hypothetical protein
VSPSLRNIYLLILVDILKVFALITSYVKGGALSKSVGMISNNNLENYVIFTLREDERLAKIYEHMNALVLAEIANTTTQLSTQLGQLTLCTEAIHIEVQSMQSKFEARYRPEQGTESPGKKRAFRPC